MASSDLASLNVELPAQWLEPSDQPDAWLPPLPSSRFDAGARTRTGTVEREPAHIARSNQASAPLANPAHGADAAAHRATATRVADAARRATAGQITKTTKTTKTKAAPVANAAVVHAAPAPSATAAHLPNATGVASRASRTGLGSQPAAKQPAKHSAHAETSTWPAPRQAPAQAWEPQPASEHSWRSHDWQQAQAPQQSWRAHEWQAQSYSTHSAPSATAAQPAKEAWPSESRTRPYGAVQAPLPSWRNQPNARARIAAATAALAQPTPRSQVGAPQVVARAHGQHVDAQFATAPAAALEHASGYTAHQAATELYAQLSEHTPASAAPYARSFEQEALTEPLTDEDVEYSDSQAAPDPELEYESLPEDALQESDASQVYADPRSQYAVGPEHAWDAQEDEAYNQADVEADVEAAAYAEPAELDWQLQEHAPHGAALGAEPAWRSREDNTQTAGSFALRSERDWQAHDYASQVAAIGYAEPEQDLQGPLRDQRDQRDQRERYDQQPRSEELQRYMGEHAALESPVARIGQAYGLNDHSPSVGVEHYEHTPVGSWRRNASQVLEPRPTTMRARKRRSPAWMVTAGAVVAAAIVLGYGAARLQTWREKHALQLTAAGVDREPRATGASARSPAPLEQLREASPLVPATADTVDHNAAAQTLDQNPAAQPTETSIHSARAANSGARTFNAAHPHSGRARRGFTSADPESSPPEPPSEPAEALTSTADRAPAEDRFAAVAPEHADAAPAQLPAAAPAREETLVAARLQLPAAKASSEQAPPTAPVQLPAAALSPTQTLAATLAQPPAAALSAAQTPAQRSGATPAREQTLAAAPAQPTAAAQSAPAPAPANAETAASPMNAALDRAVRAPAAPARGDDALAMVDEVTRTAEPQRGDGATRPLQPSASSPTAAAQVAKAPAGPPPVLTVRPLDSVSAEPGAANQPGREQVRDAMLAMQPQLTACAGGKHGTSYANVTIQGSGRVSYSLIDGAFAGTEAGSCMARVLRAASFPSFAGPPFKVRYPLVF